MVDEPAPAPLSPEEVRALPDVPAAGLAPREFSVGLGVHVVEGAAESEPQVTARVTPLEPGPEGRGGARRFRVDVEARGVLLPLDAELPRVPTERGSPPEEGRLPPEGLDSGYRPEFLDFRAIPRRTIPDEMLRAEDTRYPFSDISFPWCTYGRVTSGAYGGQGLPATGVMVGPRHLLTLSRIIGWHGSGPADWVRFAPAYSHGVAPFGVAHAERIYSWQQPELYYNINRLDLHARDYVVCILDRRLGELTGWVGWHHSYEQQWDGRPVWAMVAYSQDFAAGEVLVFQDGLPVLRSQVPPGTTAPGSGLVLHHDATIGQPHFGLGYFHEIGGPLFGWWPGEAWPRVVGLHTQNEPAFPPTGGHWVYGRRMAGGGAPLAWLIEQARAEFP